MDMFSLIKYVILKCSSAFAWSSWLSNLTTRWHSYPFNGQKLKPTHSTRWLVSPEFYSCVSLHNQQHVLVMCAVAFYMMENYPLDVGAEFMAGIIQVITGFQQLHPPLNWVAIKRISIWSIFVSIECVVHCRPSVVWRDGISQRGLHPLHYLPLRASRAWAPAAVGAVVPCRRRSAGQTQRGPSQHAVTAPGHGSAGPDAHLHVHG